MNIPLLITAAAWMSVAIAWSIWRTRTEAGESMPDWFRFHLTVACITTLACGARIAQNVSQNGSPMAFGLVMMVMLGIYMGGFLMLFVLWHRVLFGFIARPITNAFDGGSSSVEAKPFYSRAHALRRRGEFTAAIEDIEGELARFPKDSEGWFLMASIQAADLQQPLVALATLEEYLAAADPGDRAAGILQQAEIELNHLQRPDSAREHLERIVRDFDGSAFARIARQKLAHLPQGAWLNDHPLGDRDSLPVVQHTAQIGLLPDLGASLAPTSIHPEDLRDQLFLQLEQFPHDHESRERLARLYTESLQRPDLAHEELERLIAAPDQSDRDIARWLNLIADIHLQSTEGIHAARMTLQRILDRMPDSAPATTAERRITLLRREAKDTRPEERIRIREHVGNVGLETDRRFSATRANIPGLLQDPEKADPPS